MRLLILSYGCLQGFSWAHISRESNNSSSDGPVLFRNLGPKPHKHQRVSGAQVVGFWGRQSKTQFSNLGLYLVLVAYTTPLVLMHSTGQLLYLYVPCTWPLFKQCSKLRARPSLYDSLSCLLPIKSDSDSFYLNVFWMYLAGRLEGPIHSEPVLVYVQ